MRRGHLPFVAIAVGGALLLAGGSAHSQTPSVSIVATDNAFKTADGGAANVTVAAGATVGFSQGGSNPHNVVFDGAQPACVQTTPNAGTPVPPLPPEASSQQWAGTCTFTAPATYAFHCAFHGTGMSGSVTVPGTPPPPPPPASSPPPPPPPVGSAPRATTPQRGFTLRGSVQVGSAGSRLLARAFAKRRAIYGGRSNVLVQAGRIVRSSVGPGRVSFGVPLNAAARRALRRNGRLAITLRLTVTPPSGSSYTASRAVILRAP